MKKITLTLREVIILASELQHLLSLKMKGSLKFEFKDFSKQFIDEAKSIEEARVELVKSLGEENQEGWKVKDENIDEYKEEFEKILDKTKEFHYQPIRQSWLDLIDIEPNYNQLFKFVERDAVS